MNQFERSKLSIYLKMDYWHPEYACRLFAGMDPETKASLEVEGHHSYDPNRTRRNIEYEMYLRLWENTDHGAYIEAASKDATVRAAQVNKFKVTYCFQWAYQKGIKIPWLDWAEENDLLGGERWKSGYTDEGKLVVKVGKQHYSKRLIELIKAADSIWDLNSNPNPSRMPTNKDVEALLKAKGWDSDNLRKAAAAIIRPDHVKGRKA